MDKHLAGQFWNKIALSFPNTGLVFIPFLISIADIFNTDNK